VFPTRVLDIGGLIDMDSPPGWIRLLSAEEQRSDKYIALSHCWGPFRRAKENILHQYGESGKKTLSPHLPYDKALKQSGACNTTLLDCSRLDLPCTIYDDHSYLFPDWLAYVEPVRKKDSITA
jgi:hypothetical protein